MVWKEEKIELERLINEGFSYEEIGRIYGCTGANVKKAAKRLGIKLSQRRKINEKEHFNRGTGEIKICENCGKEYYKYKGHRGRFCSHECCIEFNKKELIKRWENGEYDGDNRYRLSPTIKEYIMGIRGNVCEVCKQSYINPYTKLSILQIHHIDGDASNNHPENLQVLCPNCHAMTENFGSRNKFSARGYRKEEYKNKKKPD